MNAYPHKHIPAAFLQFPDNGSFPQHIPRDIWRQILAVMKIVFDDPNTTNNLLILDCNIPLRNNAFARQALLYASRIFIQLEYPTWNESLCGLRASSAVFLSFRISIAVSFLLISAF